MITQLFYDNQDFFSFRERCRAAGIQAPIVPGLLPVTNFAQIQRITSLCGAKLPAAERSILACDAVGRPVACPHVQMLSTGSWIVNRDLCSTRVVANENPDARHLGW